MKNVYWIIAIVAAIAVGWYLGNRVCKVKPVNVSGQATESEEQTAGVAGNVEAPVRNTFVFFIRDRNPELDYFVKINNAPDVDDIPISNDHADSLLISYKSIAYQEIEKKSVMRKNPEKEVENTFLIYSRKKGSSAVFEVWKYEIKFTYDKVLKEDGYALVTLISIDGTKPHGKDDKPVTLDPNKVIITPMDNPPIKPVGPAPAP